MFKGTRLDVHEPCRQGQSRLRQGKRYFRSYPCHGGAVILPFLDSYKFDKSIKIAFPLIIIIMIIVIIINNFIKKLT